MKLEDLVDLEAQLLADVETDPTELRTRDRRIFSSLGNVASDNPEKLLPAWLRALRAEYGRPNWGNMIGVAYRWVWYLLTGLGVALGWGTAQALLHFEKGGSPVNAGNFLALVIGLQLLLLTVLLVAVPLLRWFPNMPILGDVYGALGGVVNLFVKLAAKADAQLTPEHREAWLVARSRFRMRARSYSGAEQWLLVSLGQMFGVAFNLGVLISCGWLFLFSDVPFSWSTTISWVDTSVVHWITTILSTPWAETLPAAVPSWDLVANSQYFRLDGSYAGAAPGVSGDAELVGTWWRFLIAATVVYGLLPRAVLLVGARVLYFRALARVPLDTMEIRSVIRRLTAQQVETRAVDHASHGAEPAREFAQGTEPPSLEKPGTVSVVLWRDLPAKEDILAKAVHANLQAHVARAITAGGADATLDQAGIQEIVTENDQILVVAEAWEAPDKSVRSYLRALRTAAGPRRTLTVGLVEEFTESGWVPASENDAKIWRDRLTLLEDPYLGTVSFEATQ